MCLCILYKAEFIVPHICNLGGACSSSYFTGSTSDVGRHFSKLPCTTSPTSGHISTATKEVWAPCYHLQHTRRLAWWDFSGHRGSHEWYLHQGVGHTQVYMHGWNDACCTTGRRLCTFFTSQLMYVFSGHSFYAYVYTYIRIPYSSNVPHLRQSLQLM